MSNIQLRNSDNDPYLYLEANTTGSAVVGIDTTGNNNIVKICTGLVDNIDPTSVTASISIDPAANGDITISPKGLGETIINNGSLDIQANAGSAGNLLMTNTAAAGLSGVIELGGDRFIHNFGTNNTFVGELAGNFSSTGTENTAVGTNALNSNATAVGQTAIGFNTLTALTSGIQNTAIGYNALASATSANQNTAVGYNSLAALTSPGIGGGLNAAFGNQSLHLSTLGRFNTAIGVQAFNAMNGDGNNDVFNTALGCEAGWSMTSGINNTLIGAQAGVATLLGSGLLTGNNNVIIGAHAGENYTGAESSNIMIGSGGVASENNTIRVGDGSTQTQCFITGINGVSVTAAGTVVISSSGQLGTTSGAPTAWNDVTAASATMAINNGYVADRGTLVTLTLPAVAAFGSRFEIVGKGSGGWTINQGVGQQIHFGHLDTTSGAGGSLSSTLQYDCVELICVTANTSFVVKSSIGNLTVV